MADPDGVPALQDPDVQFPLPDLAIADGPGVQDSTSTVKWGIFDGTGQPVIIGDSVLTFDYARDANISKYPVEKGGFASYNKTQVPFGARFRFTKGGTDQEVKDFLSDVKVAQDATQLFQAITTKQSYSNVSITHVSYGQTSHHGVELQFVDVWCEEVRESQPLQYSNSNAGIADQIFSDTPTPLTDTADPGAADPAQNGTVQPTTPPQTSIPAVSTDNARFGTITGLLHSPPTITAPSIQLTSSLGNIVPPSIASASRASITYSQAGAPATALVSTVLTGALNQTIGYQTVNGVNVSVNLVQHILPPGFTVVQ